MGNCELRRMCSHTPIVTEEIDRMERLHKTFSGDLTIDRNAFGNLFDTAHVSYALVDTCFAAYDTNNNGTIDMAELVMGICLSVHPRLGIDDTEEHLRRRLGLLFQIFDQNGDKLLTKSELVPWVEKVAKAQVERHRSFIRNVIHSNCRGCNCAVSPASHYWCVTCTTRYVLGIPDLALFCTACGVSHSSFESTHQVVARSTTAAPTPKVDVHEGMMCLGCAMSPLVGSYYRCDDCSDDIVLCQKCFENNIEPGSHDARRHNVTHVDKRASLNTLVQTFVDNVFQSGDLNGDGYLTRKEFEEWGIRNDVVVKLMCGCLVMDVRPEDEEESYMVEHKDLYWAPDIGIIPADEV